MRILSSMLILIFLITSISEVEAQRRRKRPTNHDNVEYVPLRDKITYDINIGNINVFNSNINFAFQLASGYKLHDKFSLGLNTKLFWNYVEFIGDDISLLSYGGGAYGRFKITNQIYLQGEYAITSYENNNGIGRETYNYPLVGAGYSQGFGNWTGGLQALFVLDEDVRELAQKGPLEWWLTFNHNF